MAASNQYSVGSYVAQRPNIFYGMTGETVNKATETKLNREFAEYFGKISHKTQLRILYSVNEATYERDTVDMLSFIKDNNIECVAKECDFHLHDEVGIYLKPWARDILIKIKEECGES